MRSVAPAFARAAAAAQAARAPPTADPPPAAAPRVAPDDRHGLLITTVVWALVVLMIVPEGFDYSTLATTESPEAGGLASRVSWIALLLAGAIALLARPAAAWRLARSVNPFLLGFVARAAASVAWSIDPAVTARRMVRIVTIVSCAMAFALVAWQPRRFQQVLRPVITLMLLGSIAFGLAWPTLAIHQEITGPLVGAWHGLSSHKNGLGELACVGMIFWFHAWLSRESGATRAVAGAAIAAACVILSRSSTSMVATTFTLLFLLMLLRSPPSMRRAMPWLVALYVGALLTYSLVLLQILPGLHTLLSPIGAATGKDMTFSGRTDIWDIMWEHIREHPWLGSGYGAYWTGIEQGSPSYEHVVRLDFYPGSAHNGYLEILSDLGRLGLLVLLGYLAVFVAQSLRLAQAQRSQAALYLALFLQQAISNLAESRWLSVMTVDFVIMTLATTALARALLEQRLHPAVNPHAAP